MTKNFWCPLPKFLPANCDSTSTQGMAGSKQSIHNLQIFPNCVHIIHTASPNNLRNKQRVIISVRTCNHSYDLVWMLDCWIWTNKWYTKNTSTYKHNRSFLVFVFNGSSCEVDILQLIMWLICTGWCMLSWKSPEGRRQTTSISFPFGKSREWWYAIPNKVIWLTKNC